MPKISVILPTYNCENFVAKTIKSVLNQTFEEFEFIIIDDASTDRTRNIINFFAKKDRRIKVILNKKNLGIPKTLNKAIREASGKYIAILNHDDLWKPKKLELQFDFLEKNLNIALCGTWVKLIDEKDKFIGKVSLPTSSATIVENLKKGYAGLFQPAVMIRKEIFEKIGGYREDLKTTEDIDIFIRIGEIYKITNIPQYLTLIRLHINSFTVENYPQLIGKGNFKKYEEMDKLLLIAERYKYHLNVSLYFCSKSIFQNLFKIKGWSFLINLLLPRFLKKLKNQLRKLIHNLPKRLSIMF